MLAVCPSFYHFHRRKETVICCLPSQYDHWPFFFWSGWDMRAGSALRGRYGVKREIPSFVS